MSRETWISDQVDNYNMEYIDARFLRMGSRWRGYFVIRYIHHGQARVLALTCRAKQLLLHNMKPSTIGKIYFFVLPAVKMIFFPAILIGICFSALPSIFILTSFFVNCKMIPDVSKVYFKKIVRSSVRACVDLAQAPRLKHLSRQNTF